MTELRRLAQEWFQRGANDLRTAQIGFSGGAPSGTIAILLHQACEKYLKGFLTYHGWQLRRTHNLVFLIGEALKHNEELAQFIDLAGKLTSQYLEERYPPGPIAEFSPEGIKELIKQTQNLIAMLRECLGSP